MRDNIPQNSTRCEPKSLRTQFMNHEPDGIKLDQEPIDSSGSTRHLTNRQIGRTCSSK